jgi:hypothetical protein
MSPTILLISLLFEPAHGATRYPDQQLVPGHATPNEEFACSLAPAGDVNADGYDDLLVGSYENGADYQSFVFLYLGSGTGLDPAHVQELGPETGLELESRWIMVSGTGDLDADGYADIAVSDDYGAIHVWYGAADGLDPGRLTTLDPEPADEVPYWSLAGAGDVNGDGYSELLVGSPETWIDGTETNAGDAFLFWGGPDGVDEARMTHWTASDVTADLLFGTTVAGGGDLDADGYADLLVSATGDNDDTGALYVYLGGPGWAAGENEHKIEAPVGDGELCFGETLAAAGDVNGDGHDDVVVGDLYWGGKAGLPIWTFFGADDGLGADPTRLDFPLHEADQAFIATAGDVNNDGLDDILGAGLSSRGHSEDDATVVLYLGSTSDISDGDLQLSLLGHSLERPSGTGFGTVLTGAGDLNGDGWYDVVVGAPSPHDEIASAWIFYGCEDADGDGACADDDCDDIDPKKGSSHVYRDADGDGYGDISDCRDACPTDSLPGFVAGPENGIPFDCDDSSAAVNPGRDELCSDGVDNDCDGSTNEDDAIDATVWYLDYDGDGFGDADRSVLQCEQHTGYVASGDDCDDDDPGQNPGATEISNGEDDDCDGEVDEQVGTGDSDTGHEHAESACGCMSGSRTNGIVGLLGLLLAFRRSSPAQARLGGRTPGPRRRL